MREMSACRRQNSLADGAGLDRLRVRLRASAAACRARFGRLRNYPRPYIVFSIFGGHVRQRHQGWRPRTRTHHSTYSIERASWSVALVICATRTRHFAHFKVAYMCPPICISCSTLISAVARRKADVDRVGGAARALNPAATESTPDELRDLLAQISSYTETAAFETKKCAGALNEIRFDVYQRMLSLSTALGYAGAASGVRAPLSNIVEDIMNAAFPAQSTATAAFAPEHTRMNKFNISTKLT